MYQGQIRTNKATAVIKLYALSKNMQGKNSKMNGLKKTNYNKQMLNGLENQTSRWCNPCRKHYAHDDVTLPRSEDPEVGLSVPLLHTQIVARSSLQAVCCA